MLTETELEPLVFAAAAVFALTAAQVDVRIKAVATASMYNISDYIRNGLGNTMTERTAQPDANAAWGNSVGLTLQTEAPYCP